MLQGSVRRRNAKQELSQRRQVRDDGAATMLQGSVRRRNAKQEVQQRRKVRDDGAATMLQGSVRRRNSKEELSQRRQAREDEADDAALRAAFGSPLYRIDRHGDDVVKTALDDMRKTLPRATAHLDRGQLASPTVREPSADYVANARSAAAKEQYIASRTRPPPPRQTKPSPYGAPILGPAGPVRRRWRAQAAKTKINGERLETLLPYATPQIRRRQRPASARPAGAGVKAAQARKRPGSAAATRKMVVDQVESKARSTFRGRALALPKEAAPKPTPFGALKALSGELGVPKRDRDQITTIVKAQILRGRAPTADRILEAHADLLRRHRADAIAAIKACKAREAIIQAAQAAAADCDGDQVSAVAPFAPKLEDATRAVELSIREWRRRLARPAPFRYRGCLYGEVMAHERVVFDKAANATDDAQDEVVRWLMRREIRSF